MRPATRPRPGGSATTPAVVSNYCTPAPARPYDVRRCVHRPPPTQLEPPGVEAMSKPSFAGRTLVRGVHPAQPAAVVAPAAAAGRPGQPDRPAHRAPPAQPHRHAHARPEHPARAGHSRPVPAPRREVPHPRRLVQRPRRPRHGDDRHPVRPQRRARQGLPRADARADGAQPPHDQPHADAARPTSRRPPPSTSWQRPGSSSRPTTGSPTTASPTTTSRSPCRRATPGTRTRCGSRARAPTHTRTEHDAAPAPDLHQPGLPLVGLVRHLRQLAGAA